MIEKRQPIVTVLGHVDHGKTTLLDTIRKSNVTAREAGGITQSIGASIVQTDDGKKITFIDTPGHAAFSGMRSRGARVADIAILIVAADDGLMPQTKEAIGFIREANIPFIVAFTKIDLPNANVEAAKASIEREGVYLEGRGGDVPFVEVSAKEGKGIKELLDLIALVSEVNDIIADPEGELEAVVIETAKDNRGPLASVVVRNGNLAVTTEIKAGELTAKVRGLFDYQNKPVKKVAPGEPALILGFSDVPEVGTVVRSASYTEEESRLAEQRSVTTGKISEGQIPLLFKAQNAGSMEALLKSLPPEVFVISASVGELTENDIFLAKSAGALIMAFDVKVSNIISKLAETEKVKIQSYKIIYELLEKIDEMVKAGIKHVVAKAEIIASFPFNAKKVAGCRLEVGPINRGMKLKLMRGEEELGEVRAGSLRRGKDEVSSVSEGEFGVILEPQLDFTIGDVLISRQ
jgi:translation initiation factor IF-2